MKHGFIAIHQRLITTYNLKIERSTSERVYNFKSDNRIFFSKSLFFFRIIYVKLFLFQLRIFVILCRKRSLSYRVSLDEHFFSWFWSKPVCTIYVHDNFGLCIHPPEIKSLKIHSGSRYWITKDLWKKFEDNRIEYTHKFI